MRTKNAKRLWPVPATLAVMALAAFLAFGLMATNGAQPAEAQSTPDCKVANTGPAIAGEDTPAIADTLTACSTSKSSALVALDGSVGLEDADDLVVWVYAKGGSIAGGTTLNNLWDHDATAAAEPDAPKATRFSGVRLEIPEGIGGGVGGGGDKRQTANITVTPATGNDDVTLYVYYQSASPVPAATFNHDNNGNNCDDIASGETPCVLQINAPTGATSGSMAIKFLGAPAVGKDGADLNKGVDDNVLAQCYANSDSRMRVIAEAAVDNATACPDTTNQTALDPNPDMAESRSTLVAISGASGSETLMRQIDGTTATHKPAAAVTDVTVYAVVQDANENHLKGAEVNFSVTIEPASVAATLDFDTDRDVDAKTVGTADGDVTDPAVTDDGIEAGDAVAMRTIEGLPTDKPYKVTFTVTADGVSLGEIVIAREGAADKVLAAIFSAECFTAGGTAEDPDYAAATFKMTNDGCENLGASGRFGRGQMVFVKAHIEDALGNIIGDGTDIDSELANEDDNLIGDADPTLIENPVMPAGDPARAWLYMIDKDATLGDHMITISTDTKGVDAEGEDRDIDSVTLTVDVAGPPHTLDISGASSIPLNGSQTFTITATDMGGGIPFFTTGEDRNDMVTISVQPTDALVVGLNASNQVMLDSDTGMAEFTVFASLDADDGDAGRIIARSGELEHILPITFGEVSTEQPSDELMPPTGVGVSPLLNTITVFWDQSSAQNATLIKVVLFNEDSTAIVDIQSYPAASDPGAHDFKDVSPGTYEVVVAAFHPDEGHELSDSHTVTIR